MSALDALYAVPAEQFIETRDALAKQLKEAGDKDGAAAVKKAHKPTQAAHALNRLVRDARGEVEALLEAGKALASGKDFKLALERQRVALEAVRARVSGPDAVAVVAVVQGALVDEQLAAQVREGRFAKLPVVPVGFFGAAPEGAPPVVLPPAPSPPMKVEALKPLPKPDWSKSVEKKPAAPAPPAAAPAPALALVAAFDLAAELKAAEKEAEALAAAAEELEKEALDAKRRAKEAADRVKKLKAKK